MKIKVKVEDKYYEVEIKELHTLPIIARIGDETFEIWPEDEELHPGSFDKPQKHAHFPGMESSSRDKLVVAPLPGTVTEIYIKSGSTIEKGTPILVIEAMKMKNKIHAGRSGIVSQVLINVGDPVRHNQALIEFTE
jgi:biotin carboxyl carrier protein